MNVLGSVLLSLLLFFYEHTVVEYGKRVAQTPQHKECPNTASPPPWVSGSDPTQQWLSMPQDVLWTSNALFPETTCPTEAPWSLSISAVWTDTGHGPLPDRHRRIKDGEGNLAIIYVTGVDYWPPGKILEGSEKASLIYAGKSSLRISSCIYYHKERVRGDGTEEADFARA